jgi:hypothetical protein
MQQAIFLANDGASCKSASFTMWALAMSNVICHGVCLGVPVAAALYEVGNCNRIGFFFFFFFGTFACASLCPAAARAKAIA